MSESTTMLGMPVHFSDKVPTLGNGGDIGLLDPWVIVEVTEEEYRAAFDIITKTPRPMSPEAERAATLEIGTMLGPERLTQMQAAAENGQRVLYGIPKAS